MRGCGPAIRRDSAGYNRWKVNPRFWNIAGEPPGFPDPGVRIVQLHYMAWVATSSMLPAAIQTAIAIIIRFSVSEIKPRGTLLDPPRQAHFSSTLSCFNERLFPIQNVRQGFFCPVTNVTA
ncbi:hypothetical protein CN138_27305 [Sinorhizobium meliloti]|uniref:Uncharacterized protein n=1 Tax=Rhizobium meliloti (strain 1021) TaxID=266834 RepID=Q92ZE5_RHIME|nr:hypothetical protein SMa1004 [Sinorhizobium meliloti 1021]AGG70224.1 Hypothetical protein SM2011_a1004 [Sinorhizobium meliloti 2011]ASP60382.1 hypothetical protein CDO30_18745 [Sinorhizobium meliloti]RVE86479.1 hypothetical protein CN235_29175 [Sinorhizobium meliloti]RVG05369.1 hypothetical protein CN234_25150 [Sinorhizobium meliloti]